MLEALVGHIVTLIVVILSLAVEASELQRQYTVPELNVNSGLELMAMRTAELPESTAGIFNEDIPDNMTTTFSWLTTQLIDIWYEELSLPSSASTEMFTIEEKTPMGTTADSASTVVPETTAVGAFSAVYTTNFMSTAVSPVSATIEMFTTEEETSMGSTAVSVSLGMSTVEDLSTAIFMDSSPLFIGTTAESLSTEVTETTTAGGFTSEDTILLSRTTASEGTWPVDSWAPTETTSYWETTTNEGKTIVLSTTADEYTTVIKTTPKTDSLTSDSTAAMATSITKPTVAIASETVASELTSTVRTTKSSIATAISYETTAALLTAIPTTIKQTTPAPPWTAISTTTALSTPRPPPTPISMTIPLSTPLSPSTSISTTTAPSTPPPAPTLLSTTTTQSTPLPPPTSISITTTLSTAMPTVSSMATQSVTSNRLTSVQSTTPEMRLPPSIVDKALDILERESFTVQTVGKIAEKLVNVTTNAEVLSISSALKATKIVANISDLISNNNFTTEMYPVPKLIGQIAAGLMNLNSTDLASIESQSKVSVQQSLEKSLSALALAAMQNGSTINETYLKLREDNLAFQVVINPSISGISIGSGSSLTQATLELVPYENAFVTSASRSPVQSRNETLVQLSSFVAQSPKAFLVYNNAKLFQAKDGLQPDSNGRVVSAQLPGNTIKKQALIKIVFPPTLDNLERKCGYWDYSAKAWSTEGCKSVTGDDNSVTCTCDHLTNFAVLLAVNNVPPNPELDILSKIGLSLSCASLVVVVITFLAIKKMRRTISQKVLFNLALSLLILDLLFLLGIDRTSSRDGCIAIAALLHYFLLTSFMWMLMESILQYLRFVKVLGTYIPRFLLKTVFPAWGIPAIIVAIVSGVDVGLYDGGQKLYCMAQKPIIYYAVLLPIGIILVINWAIFIVVLKSFYCQRRLAYQSKRSESSLAKLHAQAGVAVCTLLGLTWVFGFLTAIPDGTTSVAFQWLFCICNTLQGFVIFLFHCLRENALRKKLRKLCCRSGPLATTSLSEDSSAASKTASSVMSRNQSVSMATISSSSISGSHMWTFHKGSYNVSDAEHRTGQNTEIP